MLKWFDGKNWAPAAYWGENLIPWGTNGTDSQRPMGLFPPLPLYYGTWVRLEVPASLVGLEGRAISGMSFILYDGQITWDYSGVERGIHPAAQKVYDTVPETSDRFGWSSAVGSDGNTVVIGAPLDSSATTNAGAA